MGVVRVTDLDTPDPTATDLDPRDIDAVFATYKGELTGYCYRMLGSVFEADDAVQEVLVRVWRNADRFEGRSSVRTWLYRIATNVCLDALRGRKRRALPMDVGPSSTVDAFVNEKLPEQTWIQPIPDSRLDQPGADPGDVVVERDSVRLAFVTALQRLAPRQRAVLVLREVLRWKASEVAELLDTTTVSVNSALQRARAALAAASIDEDTSVAASDDDEEAVLEKYVKAFESYDIESLVALLREDATMSMPPYDFWISGADEIARWHLTTGCGCRDSYLVPVKANGVTAFAQYRHRGTEPWAIQMLDISDGKIRSIHSFVDPALFEAFGLPRTIAR
jgi:RNA polymerase sigma-70 factor (ECF subfamily)